MQSTLQLAEEHALKAGGTAISRICIRVGAVSGVVPESLEFAFDVLKIGTLAKSASLQIERVTAEFHCPQCRSSKQLDEVRFDCPDCGALMTLGPGGADLELSHLEIIQP
jgi:hydrogenase nickel incorporation protein HypA/HybF